MIRHFARDLHHGLWAGIAATVPMTLVMFAAHGRLPRRERYALPPEQITAEVARKVGAEPLRHGQFQTFAAGVDHRAYGGAAGLVYNGVLRRESANPLVGLSYGLAVWAVSYL